MKLVSSGSTSVDGSHRACLEIRSGLADLRKAHVILDRAGAKGTGKWMSQLALDLGVPSTLVTEAVHSGQRSTSMIVAQTRSDGAEMLVETSRRIRLPPSRPPRP